MAKGFLFLCFIFCVAYMLTACFLYSMGVMSVLVESIDPDTEIDLSWEKGGNKALANNSRYEACASAYEYR